MCINPILQVFQVFALLDCFSVAEGSVHTFFSLKGHENRARRRQSLKLFLLKIIDLLFNLGLQGPIFILNRCATISQ